MTHSLNHGSTGAMRAINDFRVGMQRLAHGVSIITAAGRDGNRYGITATAVFSLSLEPPSLVAGVNKCSGLGKILIDANNFGISILRIGHGDVANAFAGNMPERSGTDRFAYGEWRYDATGVPLLSDASACFVCEIGDIIEWSTHFLLIGVVTKIYVADGEIAPLVYFSRRFTCIGDEPIVTRAGNGRINGM
jgi:flavin reductase (DIM6/NTAB) family NADH-FMN oxidoreductase RutF